MGKLICPCPVMMRAGRVGADPPGGGAHMSFGLVSAAAKSAGADDSRATIVRRIFLLQFPFEQVTQAGKNRQPRAPVFQTVAYLRSTSEVSYCGSVAMESSMRSAPILARQMRIF